MRMLTAWLLAMAAGVAPAAAQVQIDRSRPAAKAGSVSISNPFGSVKVIAWEKGEVAVTGRLAAGAEGLDLDGDKEQVDVSVSVPESWFYGSGQDLDYRSDLEIRVPAGSAVEVETVNASIAISGVSGPVEASTVGGDVSVSGGAREVRVNGMTGAVTLDAASPEVQVETVNGPVTIRGATRVVTVRTVSGRVEVAGSALSQVEVDSTAGDVRLEIGFARQGEVRVETFSGSVELVLPPGAAARFEFQTFSGQITSDLGPKPRVQERRNPFQELRFATGSEEFEAGVKTYSGNIVLRTADPARPVRPSQ
jgi:putative adhesin